MSDIVVNGNASAPAAAATVAQSAALPGGLYQVSVSVHLEGAGTPAAADLDNMELLSDSTAVAVLPVPESKAVLFSSPAFLVNVADGKKLTVAAVGNATASVVYSATMYIHQVARY